MTDGLSSMREDFAALQGKVKALNRLTEVSTVMNSMRELDALLTYLMNVASEITGAETASILLVDEDTGELRFAAATGESGKALIGMLVPIEGSIAGTIVREDRAMIIDDAKKDPRHFTGVDEETEFQTRSILGVPMRRHDQLVGVLEVINKLEGAFTGDDVDVITILASQAAVAIENARLLESLQSANAELNRANKLKSDFIAIASHELRTPLSVITGYATFLREDSVGESSAHAQAVLDSALQMRSLIEGMTNLRHVSIDEAELDFAPLSLSQLMDMVYYDGVPLAEAKEQIYERKMASEPAMINADQARLVMALTNIVNNAVKFTPPGGVIMLSAAVKDGEVWITVSDNGIGIPEGELENIFDQFYQVEDYMTRQHGGLGLGLAIARAVINRHKGRIWAESPGLNEGSHFIVTLPLISGGSAAE